MKWAVSILAITLLVLCCWMVSPIPIGKYRNIPTHISIDDVEISMRSIARDSDLYQSIFDEPFFGNLQEMHVEYGAKFTLYVYRKAPGYDIEQFPLRYKDELSKNAEWLKFGFHSIEPQFHPDSVSTDSCQLFADAFQTVNASISLFSSESNISDKLRLHYFYASKYQLDILKNEGVKVLFAADDPERKSYSMSDLSQHYLRSGSYHDSSFIYLATDLRIEKISLPYFDLLQHSENDTLVIFTHEWALADKRNQYKLQRVLQILKQSKVCFII